MTVEVGVAAVEVTVMVAIAVVGIVRVTSEVKTSTVAMLEMVVDMMVSVAIVVELGTVIVIVETELIVTVVATLMIAVVVGVTIELRKQSHAVDATLSATLLKTLGQLG